MQPTAKSATDASLVLVTLFGLALGWAEQSFATTLGISPVKIVLSASSRSALVILSNKTDEEARFEVSVSAWSEDATGKAALDASDDLAVFPPLVTIPAGTERRIRVGLSKREPIVTERAYRLFLQEMPPSNVVTEQAGVRMLMRFSLPVFVQPAKPAGRVSVEGLAIERGHVRFRLANAGNAHARIENATLAGKDSAGKTVFTKGLDLRVLLAGGGRDIDLVLSEDECRPSTALELRLLADGKAISTVVTVPSACCGG